MEAQATGRDMTQRQVWDNIRRLEERLAERVRTVPRSAMADRRELSGDMAQTAWTRGMSRLTQTLERVTRGGIHDTDERLHAWYAAQAYARIVLFAAEKNIKEGNMYSDEVQASLRAKDNLVRMRERQMELISKTNLSAAEQGELARVRTDIDRLVRDIPNLEQTARKYQKDHFNADRNLKSVGDMAVSYYNLNEQNNMRDPRFAFGGGYAMGAALMTGYQTGQFVGERPQMWAGYHIYPGDRVLNLLSRPNYWASNMFGTHTRTFFTKMTGYTTVYHQDPERGPMAANNHEPGIIAGVQSLFKPSMNFDWLTHFYAKPLMRGDGFLDSFNPKHYKNEFGRNWVDETNWVGQRYNLPFSFKYGKGDKGRGGGSDYSSQIDIDKYKSMGMDVGEELRRRKLGLSFREEYMLWDKREGAKLENDVRQNIDAMKSRLGSVHDATERQMLQSQIREISMANDAAKGAWHLPGVRSFMRQGFYGVENRAGYDIAAIGESHRPWELYSWAMKNVGPIVTIPGMLFIDQEWNWKVFPRVARSIISPTETPTTNWYDRHKNEKENKPQWKSEIGDFNKMRVAQGKYSDPIRPQETFGIEQDLFRDALRDTFRRETPALSKFFELDSQRQSWSFQNSEYTIPLAPLYLGLYHIFRHNSSWARQQTWNQHTPREKDLGELNDEERRAERAIRTAQASAAQQGAATYPCPVCGLQLRSGQACPLHRSSDAIEQEREHKGLGPWSAKKREQLKTWVISSFSISENIGHGYLAQQDSAHCSIHGLLFKGTACPLCLENYARKEGGDARERVKQFKQYADDYGRQMYKVQKDKNMNELEKGRRLADLQQEREDLIKGLNLNIDRDTRMGFHQGRMYLQAEMERLKKMERERNYRVEFQ